MELKKMVIDKMVRPGRGRQASEAVTLTPKEVFGILRRHILLIVCLAILGSISGVVSWYLLLRYAPKYTAQTLIRVLPPVEKDPLTIGGALVSKDIRYGHRVSIANLIRQQSSMQKLIDRDRIQETNWFKGLAKTKSERIREAFKELKKYSQAFAQRDAEFISLSMTCGDKKEAALIVNEMVRLFVSSYGGTKREEILEKMARLTDQQDNVQKDLNYAEDALNKVRQLLPAGFADLEQRNFRSTVENELDNLTVEQNKITLDIEETQSAVRTLGNQAAGPINEQVERQIETDPIMTMLAQQLALTEAALAGRLTRLGENHRDVIEVRERINQIQQERGARKAVIAEQTRRSNLMNAQDSLVLLTDRLERLETLREEAIARKKDLDAARVEYEKRARIRDERKERLDDIKLAIVKQKALLDDPETPKVQSIGQAPEPLEVSFPKKRVFFPAGIMLGLIVSTGLAFLIELLNDLVRTPRDVHRYLDIDLLGVIPHADEDEKLRGVDLNHVVHQAPYSIVSESYRAMWTNLSLSGALDTAKVLLIGSGMPGDGKTPVAVNLAHTFVAEGKKVLLIDANLRQPSLYKIFPAVINEGPVPNLPDLGLSSLLKGQCGVGDIVRPTGLDGLWLIDSGPLPANPAELLSTEEMRDMIKQQRQHYDYIIVDGPPVLLVSDAKVLARVVDATILVFNAANTRRGAAVRTIRQLTEINSRIIGCVLFAAEAFKGGYFQEQFKSYRKYQKLQVAQSV
ncbi:MAG: polysaccharide biosynthesis tyrosine autokinase [Sedimentisphaerales bacterium]|nr:polysaccharide biosynthesis tyrosine autokinase [Sedimentisphaerales bacterium]